MRRRSSSSAEGAGGGSRPTSPLARRDPRPASVWRDPRPVELEADPGRQHPSALPRGFRTPRLPLRAGGNDPGGCSYCYGATAGARVICLDPLPLCLKRGCRRGSCWSRSNILLHVHKYKLVMVLLSCVQANSISFSLHAVPTNFLYSSFIFP
jgi:hypothetical protein